eukprot:3259799-Prymnesium_polylepis.1
MERVGCAWDLWVPTLHLLVVGLAIMYGNGRTRDNATTARKQKHACTETRAHSGSCSPRVT